MSSRNVLFCAHYSTMSGFLAVRPKKKCGFPVSSYKNLGRVGRF